MLHTASLTVSALRFFALCIMISLSGWLHFGLWWMLFIIISIIIIIICVTLSMCLCVRFGSHFYLPSSTFYCLFFKKYRRTVFFKFFPIFFLCFTRFCVVSRAVVHDMETKVKIKKYSKFTCTMLSIHYSMIISFLVVLFLVDFKPNSKASYYMLRTSVLVFEMCRFCYCFCCCDSRLFSKYFLELNVQYMIEF